MLINGRKFGIRVWVLVTGHSPLRIYLHKNGLALFSSANYEADSWATDAGDVAHGHVTNYAQNVHGDVWSLHQLKSHMGPENFNAMYAQLAKSTALVMRYGPGASIRHTPFARLDAQFCAFNAVVLLVGGVTFI